MGLVGEESVEGELIGPCERKTRVVCIAIDIVRLHSIAAFCCCHGESGTHDLENVLGPDVQPSLIGEPLERQTELDRTKLIGIRPVRFEGARGEVANGRATLSA